MIVRTLKDIEGTHRQVSDETWSSRRLLLREDQMGFSMHDTLIHAGTSTEMHYRNHLEAVYCVEGRGSITLLDTGETFPIEAGTIYALDKHDRHRLTAETQMRMICVFQPGLVGPETHDADGVYPLLSEADAETPAEV